MEAGTLFWVHEAAKKAFQAHRLPPHKELGPLPVSEKSMALSSPSLSRSKRSLNSTRSSCFLSPTFRRFISGKFRSSSCRTQSQSRRRGSSSGGSESPPQPSPQPALLQPQEPLHLKA